MTQYTVIDTESKRTKMKSEKKKKIKLWKKEGRHRDPTYIHTYNWNGKI